ncbi:integrase/recombinase xerD homolog [Argopecten irradians]|uniref:integrase/recombinase xerD homolog n=1 Tax=Argopecten irradians TaxID=31199 RepID=UPI00372418AC
MVNLSDEIGRLLNASISSNTKALYESALRSFNQFQSLFTIDYSWPVPLSHILWFIAFHSNKGSTPNTVKSYLAAISYIHKLHNWEDPTSLFIVKRALEGFKRLKGTPDVRAPITYDLLEKIDRILKLICNSPYETLLFKTAFCLTFFGLFRVGEVVYTSIKSQSPLLVSDMSVTDKGLEVILPRSKTDQYGRSTKLFIPKIQGSSVCPYGNMVSYMKIRPGNPGLLFIHKNNSPLTRYQFSAILRKAIIYLGIPHQNFKSHSFRIGAATTLSMKGISDEVIQRLGRWKSKAYTTYIRMDKIIGS